MFVDSFINVQEIADGKIEIQQLFPSLTSLIFIHVFFQLGKQGGQSRHQMIRIGKDLPSLTLAFHFQTNLVDAFQLPCQAR